MMGVMIMDHDKSSIRVMYTGRIEAIQRSVQALESHG